MLSSTQIKTIRLSELTGHINRVISSTFSNSYYWVIADVSNHTFYPNKDHHYFELVEKDDRTNTIIAKMQAVAWRNGTARIKHFESITAQRFKSGIKVSLKVQVDYHASYGLKLIVVDIDPAFTIGQLELHRQATINRLLQECAGHIQKAGEGFITTNNRLSHQLVIQRIAVISSSASAGYGDFMHTLVHNEYGYRFTVNSYFTTVQGEGNAEAAAKKVEEICASNIPFDAVVIIRGGGADSDFLLFDQFSLCAAIARLHIPVITGIGHLKNQTITDLVAHTCTNAPTKAAAFIVAHNHSFENNLLSKQKTIVIKTQQLLGRHNQAVTAQNALIARKARTLLQQRKEGQERMKEKMAAQSKKLLYHEHTKLTEISNKILNKPLLILSGKKSEVRNTVNSLKLLSGNLLSQQKQGLRHFETMCRMMSPLNLLKKGFALVYHQEKIITSGDAVKEGEVLKVRLIDSELKSIITQKTKRDADNSFDL